MAAMHARPSSMSGHNVRKTVLHVVVPVEEDDFYQSKKKKVIINGCISGWQDKPDRCMYLPPNNVTPLVLI